MGAISFKIPEKDKEFLEWYASRTATPEGSLYRSITLEYFTDWKLNLLVTEYSKGAISFKEMCDLGDISLTQGMLLLEEKQIEPPIPDTIDEYTISQTLKNIKSEKKDIYKNKKGIIRKSDSIT